MRKTPIAAINRLTREITRFHGHIISYARDGPMAEFPSAVDALRCTLRAQTDTARRNAPLIPDRRIDFRMGIDSGEVTLQRARISGNTVNIAARLAQIADPGSIFLSRTVFEGVSGIVSADYEPLDERMLKNIPHPVMVYRIAREACASWHGVPATSRQPPRPP